MLLRLNERPERFEDSKLERAARLPAAYGIQARRTTSTALAMAWRT